MTDEEYETMVRAKAGSMDFKKKALDKLGIDESEVSEIEPVHFEGYYFDDKKAYARAGKDGYYRSSAYEITWLFFSSTQVYIYYYRFNMDEDGKKEGTDEYFYKDITNFSTSTDSVEKEMVDKVSCSGKTTYIRRTIDTNKFKMVVPGESFSCSMVQNEYTDRAIKGMKAKLREKKG